MKLKELFTPENGIFKFLEDTFTEPFQQVFIGNTADELDAYTILNFGEKTLSENITSGTYKTILRCVWIMNFRSWIKQSDLMQKEYDVTQPVYTKTHTENGSSNEEDTRTETNSDKAYQDENMQPSDQSSHAGNRTHTEQRQVTEKTDGVPANRNISEDIQKEMELRRQNWIKSIIFAIISEITLSVYE